MPNPLRRLLLVFALALVVAGLLATGAAARLDGPPRIQRPPVQKPRPTLGQRAAKLALLAVGVPYVWGGASPASGFDCSGLVYWAYRRLGIELPHSSYALYDRGRRVARSRMKPGDLVFFSGLGHVGMYLGRGRMVHAPSSGRSVEVVRLGGSDYGGRLIGARRIGRAPS
jgi:cell wall-associated NlpC family hydrolase